MRFVTYGEKETKTIAKAVARGLKPGSIILARGTLGAGKTAFAQGLAEGLKIKQVVNSPTFNIMKVYYGKNLNFYHIDAYRLESKDAVSDIGFDEVLGNEDGVSFVEWPDFIPSWVKGYDNVFNLTINIISEKKREIILEKEEKHE